MLLQSNFTSWMAREAP